MSQYDPRPLSDNGLKAMRIWITGFVIVAVAISVTISAAAIARTLHQSPAVCQRIIVTAKVAS